MLRHIVSTAEVLLDRALPDMDYVVDMWSAVREDPEACKKAKWKEAKPVLTHIGKTTYYHTKFAWNAPHALEASRFTRRLFRKKSKLLARNIHNLSDEAFRGKFIQADISIIENILKATMDAHTIQSISCFAWRMGVCQFLNGKPSFQMGLKSEDVIKLMSEGVPSVCISYKHTRRPRPHDGVMEGYERDRDRVMHAVSRFAVQLSLHRVLFWCDIIGRAPRDEAWAAQGIDPYLWMPTLRLVSADLKADIVSSFWMSVEALAAYIRGGMMTFVEDTATITTLESAHENHLMFIPSLHKHFELSKAYLAKLICNPYFFYREARCPEDKIEVMRYALVSGNNSSTSLFPLSLNEKGEVQIRNADDLLKFMRNFSVVEDSFSLVMGEPSKEREIYYEPGQKWGCMDDFFPALRLLQQDVREELNKVCSARIVEVVVLSSNSDDVSTVLCRPRGYVTSATLQLKVKDFKQHENRITGQVICFRPCSFEEDKLIDKDNLIRKKVCFNE